MNGDFYKISFVSLFCLTSLLLFAACRQSEATDDYDSVLDFSDDMSAAAALVAEANEDLNKIKIIYKNNESKREDLKNAMKENNIESVKSISKDLVYIINDGTVLAEGAIEKIEKAEAMNINADFKEYLSLKVESLQKQKDAFEDYRQAARFLGESYNPTDEKQREKVKTAFAERDINFQKKMEVAREYSQKANDLAKEKSKKTN